ncbi:anti-sigma factor [Mycolicibacterium palauense]|uniref:anti-sigma factor n=1 Tax=Mycolicibacterium palauense TaxID=2034511 RepID=UPI000BFECF17|nr:anti-sigma factor [Mycolicibacterium palauense]
MTTPADSPISDMAVPYALHALSEQERAAVEDAVAQSGAADAFFDEVRAVREVMAAVSAATAVEPPEALRERVLGLVAAEATGGTVRALDTRRRRGLRTAILAAAAAVVIGLGAVGVGIALRPPPPQSIAQEVFAAPDVRTVSGELPAGGRATLVYSHDKHAGVLVMNNVPPPSKGTVYQMWLVGADGPVSAGTMDEASVAPSTTAVLPDLGDSTELAFTVEPGTGSAQPTGPAFATLPLV